MKIRIEFGAPPTNKREVKWYDDITKFPRVVRFEGDYWEWILYDKSSDGQVEFVLTLSKCDPAKWYGLEVADFEVMFDWQMGSDTKCECGAIYHRGFENFHSSWCPKYEKN